MTVTDDGRLVSSGVDPPTDAPVRVNAAPGAGDRVFRTGSTLAGVSVLAFMVVVGLLLLVRGFQALKVAGLGFLTTSKWEPDSHHFGIASVMTGTVLIAAVAMVVAVPVAVGTALLTNDGPAIVDKLVTVILYTASVAMFSALAIVVIVTLLKGRDALFHTNFYTQDMSKAGPLDPVTVGGIKHAVIGTLEMIAIALAITVPLGIVCAIYINEVRGRLAKLVRIVVDAMTALPSIVAGLFIYASWILIFHFQKSGFAAALAISIMMLPIIIRASDVVLRLVPDNLREASAAMGAPQWRTVFNVVLPTARSGLTTAVILGMARGIGETAPVLLTAGFTQRTNTNPLNGPMVSLPLAAFEFIQSPQHTYVVRGYATAAFLLVLVLTLLVIARIIGGHGPGRVTARQAARIKRSSARDLARFSARQAVAGPVTFVGGSPP